jgi:hypothetical protein
LNAGGRCSSGPEHGDFAGVDPRAYPRDFAVFVRYHSDLLRKISERHRLPPALPLAQFDEFLCRAASDHPRIQWL